MTTAKERIKQLIKDRFYDKPEALLRFAEISHEDLRDFMNGKRDFTTEQYARIAEQAKVPVRWLMTGEEGTVVASQDSASRSAQADASNPARRRKRCESTAVLTPKEKGSSDCPEKPRRGRPRKQAKPQDSVESVPMRVAYTERESLVIWNCSSHITIRVAHRRRAAAATVDSPAQGFCESPMQGDAMSLELVIVPSAFRGVCIYGPIVGCGSFPVWEELIRSTAYKGWNKLLCASRQSGLHERFRTEFKWNFLPGNTFHCIDFSDARHSHRVNPLFVVADVRVPYIAGNRDVEFERVANLLPFSLSILSSCIRYLDLTDEERHFLITEYELCIRYLAAVIELLLHTDQICYDADGNRLAPSGETPASFLDASGQAADPAYRLGRYADLPHVVAFFMQKSEDIFQAVRSFRDSAGSSDSVFDTSVSLGELEARKRNFDRLASILRKLASPAAFWILSGSDFPLSMRCGVSPRHLSIRYDAVGASAGTEVGRTWSNVVLNSVISESRNDFHNLSATPSRVPLNRPISVMVDDMCQMVIDKPDCLLGTGRYERLALFWGIPGIEQLRSVYGKETADLLVKIPATAVATPACDEGTRKELREQRVNVPVKVSEHEDENRGVVTFLAEADDTLPIFPLALETVPDEGTDGAVPVGWDDQVNGNYQRILAESAELCARMCRDAKGSFRQASQEADGTRT